jgi:hypothetical protein
MWQTKNLHKSKGRVEVLKGTGEGTGGRVPVSRIKGVSNNQ